MTSPAATRTCHVRWSCRPLEATRPASRQPSGSPGCHRCPAARSSYACERFERCTQLSDALDLPAVGARALQLIGVCRLEMGDLRGARAALAQRRARHRGPGRSLRDPGRTERPGRAGGQGRQAPRCAHAGRCRCGVRTGQPHLSAPGDASLPRAVVGTGSHDGRRRSGEAPRRGTPAAARRRPSHSGSTTGPRTAGEPARRRV